MADELFHHSRDRNADRVREYNFVRTTSGKALGKADEGSPDSLRIDIPKDDVDPKSRRVDGVKYVDTEQWQAMKSILTLVDEALAQAGRK